MADPLARIEAAIEALTELVRQRRPEPEPKPKPKKRAPKRAPEPEPKPEPERVFYRAEPDGTYTAIRERDGAELGVVDPDDYLT